LNTRYLIEVSYDGSRYNGWQKQPCQPTIQGEIEKALSTFFRVDINIMGSGRTDTGVHAKQQFAHFDLNQSIIFSKSEVLRSLRGLLPSDILVSAINKTSAEFHARFDAIARQYQYRVVRNFDVFQNRYSWIVQSEIDSNKMQEASRLIVGEKDFGTFSKSNPDVNHTRCFVENSNWVIKDEEEHIFTIKANRFLHHMVRSLVGTMIEVGKGNVSINEFDDMLKNPNRSKCKFTAPPHALFLDRVYYR